MKPRHAATATTNSRGVDRADHLARLHPAAGEQGRSADRAPAAAAGRVDEAGEQAERREEPLRSGCFRWLRVAPAVANRMSM